MGNSKPPILAILAIDDSPDYLQALTLEGRRHRCKLLTAGSLEEAKELIEEYGIRNIDGVILDILCMRTRDQEVEDRSFLQAALDYFKGIAPDLPRVVVTGDADTFQLFNDIFGAETVMQKSGEQSRSLFETLRRAADKAPETRLRQAYADVFEVFDKGYLDYRIRAELLETLLHQDSSRATAIHDNLARIRRIIEAIYISLSKRSVKWIPVDLFTVDGEHLALRPVLRHLQEKRLLDGLTRDFAYCTYAVASDNGSHTPYENPDYPPTRYSVQACVNMLLDLLLWFGKLMDGHGQTQQQH
ncbi:MAG: hypothetical protein HN742_27635 [Lentisphaerae bacterium]|jgi:hypothetical protein|nr:hypothetical protein [Lentisphaerota bacterium]MBT4817540.1 hypothetical protein [Lentisphaerota bacterium]MBT5605518.1 hypothetical protein [Lentisphaerota bacterium]MBT7060897.1 hypothetical protein [Lentisphaerota bacterium]MBT7845677.1 hypothetical protein [Lentisphaerota bacterium]